jgi:hypothetical protein
VDHEIKDDVDVEGARGEDAEAVSLKEHGFVEGCQGGRDGRVEALQVPDGDDAIVLASERGEMVGLRERGCEGLLNEKVDAGCEELLGDIGVMDGGETLAAPMGCVADWESSSATVAKAGMLYADARVVRRSGSSSTRAVSWMSSGYAASSSR